MNANTIRCTLSFYTALGDPAQPYQAHLLASEIGLDLGEQISDNLWDCAMSADILDELTREGALHRNRGWAVRN